ncbi:MAG: class I SAM-dependent methyltransferase [Acidimicrobiaceae bacterium]|nr:class I SAM-dependent methyltransferase [Acidimicrobiaceae bacterium]
MSNTAGNASPSWAKEQFTKLAIATQRKVWTRRADTWDHSNDAGMLNVAAAAVELANAQPGMVCVDLGCGGGRLALELARRGATVIGVDVSGAMVDRMLGLAREEGLDTVSGRVSPIEHVVLEANSIDLVISNYAFHHLLDADKGKVVTTVYGWLKPGGVFITSDMMLGRGATSGDRQVIKSKVRAMAKKGVPGYWRILKNAGRYIFRLRERPITPEAWMKLYSAAGFVDLSSKNIVAEAHIVRGVKPLA